MNNSTINNSVLFKKAHKLARKTVAQVGDYQIAFKLALEEVRNEPTVMQKVVAVFDTIGYALPLLAASVLLGFFGFGGMFHYSKSLSTVEQIAGFLGAGTFSVCSVGLLGFVISQLKPDYENCLEGY